MLTDACVIDLADWRAARAWAAAVQHLHGAGLPAAAPEDAAGWLERRDLPADWYYTGGDPFQPVTAEDPETQALLWEDPA